MAAGNGSTQWADVKAELQKAPTLPKGETYVLVMWSLNLAPELQHALRDTTHKVLGPGEWVLGVDGRLSPLQAANGSSLAPAAKGKSNAAKGKAKAASSNPSVPPTDGNSSTAESAVILSVPDGMQLILTNPHSASGGGLAELLGHALVRELQVTPLAGADVGMLKAWMAKEAA